MWQEEIPKQSLCKPKRFTIPLPFRQSNSGTFGTLGPEGLAGVSSASRTSFKLKVAFQFPCASSIVPGFCSPLCSLHESCSPLCSRAPCGKHLKRTIISKQCTGGNEANAHLLPPSLPLLLLQPRCLASLTASAIGGDRGGTGAPAWPEDCSFSQQLV